MIFDDIYFWDGWGGAFRLGSGRCRLRIYDLQQRKEEDIAFIKPIIVIATDLPKEKRSDMSVKSCNSHIATSVAKTFNIDPQRMQFVEYYPARRYGKVDEHVIPERFDAVDFDWHGDKAMKPNYRELDPPLLKIVKGLVSQFPPPPAA